MIFFFFFLFFVFFFVFFFFVFFLHEVARAECSCWSKACNSWLSPNTYPTIKFSIDTCEKTFRSEFDVSHNKNSFQHTSERQFICYLYSVISQNEQILLPFIKRRYIGHPWGLIWHLLIFVVPALTLFFFFLRQLSKRIFFRFCTMPKWSTP